MIIGEVETIKYMDILHDVDKHHTRKSEMEGESQWRWRGDEIFDEVMDIIRKGIKE